MSSVVVYKYGEVVLEELTAKDCLVIAGYGGVETSHKKITALGSSRAGSSGSEGR